MAEEELAEEVEGLDVEDDVDDLERAVGEMAEEELAEEVEGLWRTALMISNEL